MFVFVFLLCGLAVSYLYQHSCSIRLTRRIADMEKQRQLLTEKLEGVDSDVVELSGFARLESLWAAGGRLPVPIEPSDIENEVAESEGSDVRDQRSEVRDGANTEVSTVVAATNKIADEAAH
jgi:hypothetical protein